MLTEYFLTAEESPLIAPLAATLRDRAIAEESELLAWPGPRLPRLSRSGRRRGAGTLPAGPRVPGLYRKNLCGVLG